MMKGNWHLLAMSAFFSILALKTTYFILFLILLYIWLLYLYMYKATPLFVIFITSISFFFFYYYFPSYEREASHLQIDSKTDVTINGTISGEANLSKKQLSFTLKEKNTKRNIIVSLFFDETNDQFEHDHFPFMYGANCHVTGRLTIPNEATNPYQFDYKQYLFEKGITAQLNVDSFKQIECEQRTSILQRIYVIREFLIDQSNEKLHPKIAAWQQALILGNSNHLDEQIKLLFQRWGLSHLLAISGLHVSILIAFIYFVLVRIFYFTKEKARLTVLFFLPIYAVIAGGQPSVWRASLMTVFIILISTKKIKMNHTDVLSIVFLLLIFINKYLIFNIGFQFSFAVTLGLLLSKKWFSQSKSSVETIFQISFIAQMIIVPLQMYYFYHFQPLSILLNIIIVPYFSLFVIPFMFVSLFLTFLPKFAVNMFESLFLIIHNNVLHSIQIIDKYVNVPFISGEITVTIAIIYYCLLVFMMIQLEKGRKREAFQYGIYICLLLTFVIVQPYLSKQGTVTMLDIGQGDAFIIELPYRKGVFFIDAGATFDFTHFEPNDTVFRNVIEPYLMGRGIQTIDGVFISHAHLDHHGSVRFLIEQFNVKELFIPPYFNKDDLELQHWLQHDVRITKLHFLNKMTRNGQTFIVLSPEHDKHDENNNSLVLFTAIGGSNWLFTGDINKEVEKEIVRMFPNLKVDILKVAHHGSNTSTAEQLLETINPDYAFIPVGRNNRYGHPAKEIIETLQNYNVKIYRTDENGAVQYKYNGKNKYISPYVQ